MNSNIEYDIVGRVLKQFEPVTGTLFSYEYLSNGRVLTITNEKNKSNYKTIRIQTLIEDKYVDIETEEFGDTYHIIKKFSNGNEVYLEQRNIKTGKMFNKKTFCRDDKPNFWVSDYDGAKSVGFYMDKNILTGLTNNS